MPEPETLPVLPLQTAARLTEFARACRAAARAVSLYPGSHPAIATSLGRLGEVTALLTGAGAVRLEVLADRLLLGGAALPKEDTGVSELAGLLHRHLIGRLTLNPGAGAESWRPLLLLLARAPEEVRIAGGIRHLWSTAGGPGIEVEEIDYAEVLRERSGVAAAAEQIIAAALAGRGLELDDSGMRLLLEIVEHPERLAALMAQLDEAGQRQGAGSEAAAFLALLRGLAEWLAARAPHRLDSMFRQMGGAAGRLSAGAMVKLLEYRTRPEALVGTVDVAAAVVEGMGDESLSQFVAGSIVRERGATERLAHAFQALVPAADRQRRLLAIAAREVAATEGDGEAFAELWGRVDAMLTSAPDERDVSEQYARELSNARTRAIDVEDTSDDPPDRLAAWIASVDGAVLRRLDQQLLLDLLAIESDPLRWRDIAETAAAHAEDLVRGGSHDEAWALAEAVVREGGRDDARATHSAAALARFGRGMVKEASVHLRTADDASSERFARLCHAIGPGIVPPLAEALAVERDARARRRLRDVVLRFGARGRESVRQLMTAREWEVRRTAASLLREVGGAEGLRELVTLLTDTEPLVQREAIQGLVMHGSDEASKTLLQTLAAASGRARETLVTELTGVRDERAAPLFCYLVRHMDRRAERQLYLSSLEALGTFGGPDAIDALKHALHQGDWRAPIQTRRIRAAAALALRRIGTQAALDVLREAAARGTLGVRAAARSHLA